ncbi:MAG TPA: patatin-like phospholipase family protein [Fibrobacteria bacterium]|nr:patatin-like phospholipase family protein [Fibrobacteria bacterium]
MNTMRRALVLAGGGYVASSWEIGLVTGMADAGLDVRDADLFVGTSAGARVALDLASGKALEEFYQMRAGPDLPPLEPPRMVDWARLRAGLDDAKKAGGSPTEILRRVGALALAAAVGKGSDRREIVATQLPLQAWPQQRVLIVTLNAETGERHAFDKDSGIDLVDAVIATTAFFGSPPTLFNGQYYIDGGFYSSDNADLATGYERVLILALRPPPQAMRLVSLDIGVEALRAAGAQVEVIHPDEETLAALVSTGGIMNPASGRPAATAGRLQGQRSVSERIASFWR